MAYCDEVQAISVVVVCIVNDAEFISDVVVCIIADVGYKIRQVRLWHGINGLWEQ